MSSILYLLQVSACSAIFYAFYFLVIRRYTFFTLNRAYLLITLLISFIIPTLKIPVSNTAPTAVLEPVMYIRQLHFPGSGQATAMKPAPVATSNWYGMLHTVYLCVASISIIQLVVSLAAFFVRRKTIKLMQFGRVSVRRADKKLGNSSFLNTIFVNDEDLEPGELQQIIAHEMLHIDLLHSADRLVARIVQAVLWFNPFAYFYTRSIEENHEFEVDRLASADDRKDAYAQLMFKLAVSGRSDLFHGFSKVPLKKRIIMLFNKPTSNMKKITYLLVLPMAAISCLAFADLKMQPLKTSHLELKPDTSIEVNQYRQRIRRNGKEIKAEQLANRNAAKAYFASEDYKTKKAKADKISDKTVTCRVTAVVDTSYNAFLGHLVGYKVQYDGEEYLLAAYPGQKSIAGLLHPGDDVQVKPHTVLFGKEKPVVIMADALSKGGSTLYSANIRVDQQPFLFEANAVRFTDGKVTSLKRYNNGKWKSAVVSVPGGFRIQLNVKPGAPDLSSIKEGDEVRFRFVHEVKTAAKEYMVNDWVSLSNNINNFGVKNPEYFSRFYARL